MQDELLEYKRELFNQANIGATANDVFPEESFFEDVSKMLSEAGIMDDVEYCPFRHSRLGMRIDGYSWNPLEKTICGIVVNFTNLPDEIETLTNTEIRDIGKRVARFFERVSDDSFTNSLEVTDPGRIAADYISDYVSEAIKFRIVVLTDQVLSKRVRKVSIENIAGLESSIEIWDLERIRNLDFSDMESEPFEVDLVALGGGIRALPANQSTDGVSTYLCVMPGTLLSSIFDEYGQRLLESNVRTFLDFRAATNRGMRKSLVVEPENFFAYNNGITVTASALESKCEDGQLVITSLENMQIVNGGQTTSALYFAPKDKGGIKGADREYFFKDIDLSKVFVQMKLTVIGEKETADIMKANIATFANSQNSIQASDLVSNHPFHLNIEKRSRKQLMPAGEGGLATKWFYERARGQYSTLVRGMTAAQRRKFEAEYPKKQVFVKTDMAKYENTWRMKPYLVKKGAQANLKAIGAVILDEFEKDEDQFGAAFYNDLVSKMILFRQSDSAILKSQWYQNERGLKAETVTYTLALLRHALCEKGKDINLYRIFQNQKVSENLIQFIASLANRVRTNIADQDFRGGVANPSEFCKSEKGWAKIKQMNVAIEELDATDIISGEARADAKSERKELNKVSKSMSIVETVMSISSEEWSAMASFNRKVYPENHKNVAIPLKCAALHLTGMMPTDRQLKVSLEIRDEANENGFDFVS